MSGWRPCGTWGGSPPCSGTGSRCPRRRSPSRRATSAASWTSMSSPPATPGRGTAPRARAGRHRARMDHTPGPRPGASAPGRAANHAPRAPRREPGHLRAGRAAGAQRPAPPRRRCGDPGDDDRRAGRSRLARRARRRPRGHRARPHGDARSCGRRRPLPRDGGVLRHALAAGPHDDAQHRVGAGEPRPRAAGARRRPVEPRARPRTRARGGVRQFAPRRGREAHGMALDASRGVEPDRPAPHQIGSPLRRQRRVGVDARTRSTLR